MADRSMRKSAAHDAETCPQCMAEAKRAASGGGRAAEDDYLSRGKGGRRNLGFVAVLLVHWLIIAGLIFGMPTILSEKPADPIVVAEVKPDVTETPEPPATPPIPLDRDVEIYIPTPDPIAGVAPEAGSGAPQGSPSGAAVCPDVPVRIDPRRPPARPDYPASAKRLGQEGVVALLLLVAPDGRVTEARVERGSGYPTLDAAAVQRAADWRFLPASCAGKAVAAWYRTSVRFELQNS